jgi:hypothetical protein
MTITIGTFTCNALTAQPFGYEGEARDGLTARTFQVAGLLTPTQWQVLVNEYNTWRNLRIADEDTLSSGVVGTTINLTITPANGLSVTNLPCWFAEPPSGDQAGAYVSARVVMVDAAQALAVLLRTEEKNRERNQALLPNLGTLTFGTAVITLTAPADTRQDGPTVAMTATGVSYVTGPLKSHKIRNVEGYISSGTYANLLSWYDTTITSVPATGAWFPIAAPTATAEVVIDAGVKSTRYNVTMTVLEII